MIKNLELLEQAMEEKHDVDSHDTYEWAAQYSELYANDISAIVLGHGYGHPFEVRIFDEKGGPEKGKTICNEWKVAVDIAVQIVRAGKYVIIDTTCENRRHRLAEVSRA